MPRAARAAAGRRIANGAARPSSLQSRRRQCAAGRKAAGIRRASPGVAQWPAAHLAEVPRPGGAKAVPKIDDSVSWQLPGEGIQRPLQYVGHCGSADAENAADFTIAEPLAAQSQAILLHRGQPVTCGAEADRGHPSQYKLLRTGGRVGPRIDRRRLTLQRLAESPAAALAFVADQVARHPKQPSPKILLRASAHKMRVQAQKGLLTGVVGFLGACSAPTEVPEQSGAQLVEQANHLSGRVRSIAS